MEFLFLRKRKGKEKEEEEVERRREREERLRKMNDEVEERRRTRERKERRRKTSRKEKDISRQSGKRRDDNAYSGSIPRAGPPLEEEFAGLQIDFSENEPQHAAGKGIESLRKDKEKLEGSDWEWNQERNCYYRYRKNTLGGWVYEYGRVLEDGGNQTNLQRVWSLNNTMSLTPRKGLEDDKDTSVEICQTAPISSISKPPAEVSKIDPDVAPMNSLEQQNVTGGNNGDQVATIPTSSVSPHSSTRFDTLSSFSDEESDWGEDQSDISLYHISTSISSQNQGTQGHLNGEGDLIRPILSPVKQAVVDRIMKKFWEIFNAEVAGSNTLSTNSKFTIHMNSDNTEADGQAENKSSSSASSSDSKSGAARKNNCYPANEKKKRTEDHGDEEDDRERDPKRRRTLLSPPLSGSNIFKFSCPYRKHNPRKYCGNVKQWRTCAMTPLDSVARVKGHLYRHHHIFPCPRCKVLFNTQEEVIVHLNELEGCVHSEILHSEGITSVIVERLRSKKKTRKDQSEEERWIEIYQLLFPGEDAPSPYFEPPNDTQELSEYEEYCLRELPRVFRAALEGVVQDEAQLIENRLNSQLESIIRDCQERVFASYRSGNISRTQSTQTPLRSPLNSDPPAHTSTPAQEPASSFDAEQQDPRHTSSLQDHRELANADTIADEPPEQTTQSNNSTSLDAGTEYLAPNVIHSTGLDDDLYRGNFGEPDFDNSSSLNFNIDGLQDMDWDFMNDNLNS